MYEKDYERIFILRQGSTTWPWNSLCRPGWPLTHKDLPASASQAEIQGVQSHACLT